jgi:hypothetical protein
VEAEEWEAGFSRISMLESCSVFYFKIWITVLCKFVFQCVSVSVGAMKWLFITTKFGHSKFVLVVCSSTRISMLWVRDWLESSILLKR